MKMLYEERGAKIFLFQDDDFPLFGPVWQRWTREFLSELHKSGLPKKTIWKMNCRADVVEPELFAEMRDAGLYLVYMGLESGNEEGLRTLHKEISVEQNLRAVEILKSIGLTFDYGFMLFDPSSTFDSVKTNIQFLRKIVGDGSAALTFCRMLPYDGTAIKDDLVSSGRLRGDVCNPDYDFLDPRLNEFYNDLTTYLDIRGWIFGLQSLSLQLGYAWNEFAVMERLFPGVRDLGGYRTSLVKITRESNLMLLGLVEDLLSIYTSGRGLNWNVQSVEEARLQFMSTLHDERNRFVSKNQEILMSRITQTTSRAGRQLIEV
jgi:hypothetical protein